MRIVLNTRLRKVYITKNQTIGIITEEKLKMLKNRLLNLSLLTIIILSTIISGAVEGENFLSIQENSSEEVLTGNESVEGEDLVTFAGKSINLNDGEEDCIYYFYGEGCEECNLTNSYLDNLEKKYVNLNIQRFEVYYNESNLDLLNQFYFAYGVEHQKQKVPAIMISKTYFVGEDSITSFLEERIKDNLDSLCPNSENSNVIGLTGEGAPKDVVETLNVGNAGVSAINNFFRNTNSSLLLLFLILLLALLYEKGETVKEKKEQLLRGSITFIVSSYFLLILGGIGLFNFLSVDSSRLVSTILVVITIIISLMIMKRFLFEGHVVPRKYLKKLIPIYDKILHYITTPLGFLFSSLIATLYSVSNWDKTYNTIQQLTSDPSLRAKSLPLLIMHSIVFVIPLVIAFVIVYWRLSLIEKNKEPKVVEHQLKLLRFFIALFVFLAGIINLFLF